MNRHTPLSALFSDSMPRRTFLKAAILAGTARFFSTQTKVAGGSTTTAGNDGTLNRLTGRNTDLNHHILLKGGTIITMDPVTGDFAKGDLLIQGKKIIAVGPNVKAPASSITRTTRVAQNILTPQSKRSSIPAFVPFTRQDRPRPESGTTDGPKT